MPFVTTFRQSRTQRGWRSLPDLMEREALTAGFGLLIAASDVTNEATML